ncbi:MAG: ribosome small subunit-dependent GTPase A [Bacteroidetes bacterium]|nr:ribosome small subunit-dependent GTPase A [Bacteroidota bacterium]
MKGTIIKSTGNWYLVLAEGGEKINCRIKGRLRIDGYKSTNPIAVGDSVSISLEGDGNGIISDVGKRKNCIIRKSKNLSKQSHILATNVDQAMLVVTLAVPKTSFGFIDRFLATAEAYQIPAIIIFNKADIFEDDEVLYEDLKNTMSLYEKIGYQCFSVCSTKMKTETKQKMVALLKDKTTLLSGHSGVGKSTFVNAIEPLLDLKTQNLSETHTKGMHTTTFTEMHPLSFGGFIIDTPGIKEFSVINMDKYEVYHFFPEIFKKGSECKFNTCLHISEPKCAVIEAVEKGEIALSRYHSYLSIMSGEEVIKEYND